MNNPCSSFIPELLFSRYLSRYLWIEPFSCPNQVVDAEKALQPISRMLGNMSTCSHRKCESFQKNYERGKYNFNILKPTWHHYIVFLVSSCHIRPWPPQRLICKNGWNPKDLLSALTSSSSSLVPWSLPQSSCGSAVWSGGRVFPSEKKDTSLRLGRSTNLG